MDTKSNEGQSFYENSFQHLQDELFRIRIGEYRIIYAVFDDEVVVVVCKVTRRTEKTYRDLEGLLDKALRELLK